MMAFHDLYKAIAAPEALTANTPVVGPNLRQKCRPILPPLKWLMGSRLEIKRAPSRLLHAFEDDERQRVNVVKGMT